MNLHLKKLTFKMYLVSTVILLTVLFAIWLFSNSFLSVTVSPRNAQVTVDGEEIKINKFGVGRKRLPLGTHLIEIEKDGYVSDFKNLEFKRGFTTKHNVALKETPKMVEVSEFAKFLDFNKETSEIFYLGNNDSTLYKAKVDINENNEVALSGYAITSPSLWNIEDIIWSPKKDLALFRKSDGIYLFDFKKYDFVNQTENLWGGNIGSIAWSPDNSKIAYFYSPPSGERSLIFSNLDNSRKERIVDFSDYGIVDPELVWSPDSEQLLIIPKSTNKSNNKLYILNAYTRALKQVTEEGNVTSAFFSPQSKRIFYSQTVEEQEQMYSFDLDGDTSRYLSLSGTAGKNIYYAENIYPVPKLIVSNKDEFKSKESIFTFDLFDMKKDGFSVNWDDVQNIQKVFQTEKKVIIFESEQGIFAFNASDL